MPLQRLALHAPLAVPRGSADPLPAVSTGGPNAGSVLAPPSSVLLAPPGDDEGFPSHHLPYLAAWVAADDPARPWDPTPAAVRWLLQRAERLNLKLALVSDGPLTGPLPPALRYFQLRADLGSRRPAAGRAVLAYLPSLKTAARAFRLAGGGAVAVIEGPALPLTGWAAEARAIDLLTSRHQGPIPTETSARLRQLLQSLDDAAQGSDRAEAVLAALRVGGRAGLTADDIAGCLLAYGCSPRGIRRLLKLAPQASAAGSRAGRQDM